MKDGHRLVRIHNLIPLGLRSSDYASNFVIPELPYEYCVIMHIAKDLLGAIVSRVNELMNVMTRHIPLVLGYILRYRVVINVISDLGELEA